jgi:adenylosuccinate synthase
VTEERRAHLVVDLGFGDAGKGHVVDWLVRTAGARLVVRYNGGAQAGHTVVTDDGRAHTFAQIGAGSFVPGVRTFLAAPVVVHPTALAVEAEVLARAGVPDVLARLAADARCRVITPYHQAMNRLRELARGGARHGSCGVGVGETVADSLSFPDDTITLGTLRDATAAARILARVRERKRAEARTLVLPGTPSPRDAARACSDAERALLDDEDVPRAWLGRACALARAITIAAPGQGAVWAGEGDVVFEGAQGVLLDHAHGFRPHTTWSDCTLRGADDVLDAWRWPGSRRRIGVHRVHHVRHGDGPLPSETRALDALAEPHNGSGPWQGAFRRGWLDLSLLARAAHAVEPLDAVALTHVDALALDAGWRVHDASGPVALPSGLPARAAAVIERVERAAGAPVSIRSRGPRPSDVSARS